MVEKIKKSNTKYYTEYPDSTFFASSDEEALQENTTSVFLWRDLEEGEVSSSKRYDSIKILRESEYYLNDCTDHVQIGNGAIVGWNEDSSQFMTTYETELLTGDFSSPDFDDPVRPATVEEMKEYVSRVGHSNLTDSQIDAYFAGI